MAMKLTTVSEIEDAMADVMLSPAYAKTVKVFDRLLDIMGNVDGNEIVALVILAVHVASEE